MTTALKSLSPDSTSWMSDGAASGSTVTRIMPYSVSPPSSNFPRAYPAIRSSPAFTSGGRSLRFISRSASRRMDSRESMKFPFLSLPASSAMVFGVEFVSDCSGGGELWNFRARQLRRGPPLANLLAPHCIVQSRPLQELVVLAGFDDLPALENVDAIRVHHRRQAVRDENRDDLARGGDIPHCP